MPDHRDTLAMENERLMKECETLRARVHELEKKQISSVEHSPSGNTAPSSSKEDFFRSLLNAIPDLVWLKDADGVYMACNGAFELFFGAKEKDIVGKTDYDFVDKELADFFRMQDNRALLAGRPSINEEWLTIAATGQRQLVETIKTPIKNKTGELIGVLGISRDITDRKRAEEALEKRITALTRPLNDAEGVAFEDLFNLEDIQRLQDQFSDATGVASLITHPDGSPITKPSNFCRLCMDIIRKTEKGRANCYKSDAALGRLQLNGPSIQPCMSGGLWDAGAGISVGGHHIANWLIGQIRDEGQTEEKIREYARQIEADEDEAAAAFAEVPSMPREQFERISNMLFTLASRLSDIAYQNVQQARFIHDLKETEEELAATRNYLTNIIDSMPSLLVGVDTECAVTQWNMKAEQATSILSKDAVGKQLDEVMPRLAGELERVREAIRTRTARSDQLHSSTPDRGPVHENITIYPLVANGVNGAVVRIDDVTDRVKLEQMMVQSEKMMSVGGVAAGMAHEINNPLSGVLGYVTNIKNRIFGDLAKNEAVATECGVTLDCIRDYLERRDIKKMLDGIHESGVRAATIVSNMLSFSRKSEKQLQNQDMATVLDEMLELAASDYNLKKYYDFRKIEIVREYEKDMPPVYCEKNEIQQVFLNLLKNGAESMNDKEYVDDRPRFICRIMKHGPDAVVEIEDNGPGIEESVRKRIFEPFFTTKGVGKGTGLGLSVSYFIITDQHRGAMEVDSSPGEWTRFTITLPLNRPDPAQEDRDAAHDPGS